MYTHAHMYACIRGGTINSELAVVFARRLKGHAVVLRQPVSLATRIDKTSIYYTAAKMKSSIGAGRRSGRRCCTRMHLAGECNACRSDAFISRGRAIVLARRRQTNTKQRDTQQGDTHTRTRVHATRNTTGLKARKKITNAIERRRSSYRPAIRPSEQPAS